MILPDLERRPGARPVYVSDCRVPTRVDYAGDLEQTEPRRLAGWQNPETCHGRHLFDVIESVREHELDPDPDDWRERSRLEYDYRMTLTCVRCGLVREHAGRRTVDESRQVDPTPIGVGALRAQMVSRASWGDTVSTWFVVDVDDQVVGAIGWATGPRGRHYFVGRLNAWDDDRPALEGKTPRAVLGKLAKAPA